MQAAFYERTGPAAEVLTLGELSDPRPGPGEVRVRLRWSGVNPSDVKSRAGLRSKVLAFPRIVPHSDGMGVIDAVGEGVSASRVGERVCDKVNRQVQRYWQYWKQDIRAVEAGGWWVRKRTRAVA